MKIKTLMAGLLLFAANGLSAQKGSLFFHGFARIEENGKNYYINTAGEKMFDEAIGTFHPLDTLDEMHNGQQLVRANENEEMTLVRKNGRMGVVTDRGTWLLQPEYDTIDFKWKSYLALSKNDKMTYADTRGKLLLPLRFQDAGILDNDHFDVKENGKWGIYSASENKLVIPAVYEAFDYCGGCGSKGGYVFAQKNGKWGVVDFNNQELLPFEYDHEHAFMRSDNWVLSFKKNGKDIVINLALKKEYNAPEYDNMELIGNGLLKARKNGRYGLINDQGNVVADFVYEDITDPYGAYDGGPFLQVVKNKKHGVLREDGKMVVAPVYDGEVTCFAGYFIVPVNGNYNLLDSSGKKLLAKDYSEVTGMGGNADDPNRIPLFKLKQKALYGYYNPVIRKTVEPAFHDIDRIVAESPLYDLLEVTYQEKRGLYNIAGEQVLPVEWKAYDSMRDGFLAVRKPTGTGLYHLETKKEIIPPLFYQVEELEGDSSLFMVTTGAAGEDHHYGIYNSMGVLLLPAAYQDIKAIGNGRYLVYTEKNNITHYAIFHNSTTRLMPLSFSQVTLSGEPDILIVNDGKSGYLWNAATGKPVSALYPLADNGAGQEKVAPLLPFISGLSAVVKAGKTGFINTRGEVVIPFDYDAATVLKNGAVMLLKKQASGREYLYGYADSTGKIVVPIEYNYNNGDYNVSYDDMPYLLLQKSDEQKDRYKEGLALRDGHILIQPEYDRILTEKNGLGFLGQTARQFRVLDSNGKPLSHQLYNDVMLDQSAVYGLTDIAYHFPLLCRKGDYYEYLCADGKLLPVKITEMTSFVPDQTYGIPEL